MLAADKKLDHMTWKTELMTKNMEDMDASSSMMVRVLDKTEKSAQLLQSVGVQFAWWLNRNCLQMIEQKQKIHKGR